MVDGRCMKCQTQVTMEEPEEFTMKNGRQAVRGSCPHCSSKVVKIGATLS